MPGKYVQTGRGPKLFRPGGNGVQSQAVVVGTATWPPEAWAGNRKLPAATVGGTGVPTLSPVVHWNSINGRRRNVEYLGTLYRSRLPPSTVHGATSNSDPHRPVEGIDDGPPQSERLPVVTHDEHDQSGDESLW